LALRPRVIFQLYLKSWGISPKMALIEPARFGGGRNNPEPLLGITPKFKKTSPFQLGRATPLAINGVH